MNIPASGVARAEAYMRPLSSNKNGLGFRVLGLGFRV